MINNNDITFEQLLDWLEGRLSPEAAQQIEQRLPNASPEIQAQLKWLRAFETISDQITLATPPASLQAKLAASFTQYAEAKANPGLFQRLVAMLTFDSALQPAMAGMRSAESARSRQWIYSTEQADISLQLQRRQDNRVDLLGQILLNTSEMQPETMAVQLLRNQHESNLVMADDLGEFVFESVEPDQYEMVLSGDRGEIVISGLDLNESSKV